MMFINSFRLLISNFTQFWKVILNKFFVLLASIVLLLPFLKTYLLLDYTLFFEQIKHLFLNLSFINVGAYFQNLYSAVNEGVALINNLYVINPFCLVYTFIVLFGQLYMR